MRVLLVEDDAIILEGLKSALTQEGYQVVTASDMAQARTQICQGEPIDFYLLDLMLPDGDGCTLCSEIRQHSNAPVLFLTACDDEVSTVRALEQGADDYIAKPFRIRELLARMKAVRRRTGGTHTPQVQEAAQSDSAVIGDVRVDLRTGRLYCAEEEILLTAMEYRLLLIFLNHRGQTLTRRQILGCIWDEAGEFVNDNTLSVYIRRLRAKLHDTPQGQLIRTVRGIGYFME